MALYDKSKSGNSYPDRGSHEEPIVLANIDELIIPADDDKSPPSKKKSGEQFMDFGDTPAEDESPPEEALVNEKSFVSLDDFEELDFNDMEDGDNDDDATQPDFEAYYLSRRNISDDQSGMEPDHKSAPLDETGPSKNGGAPEEPDEYARTDAVSFFDDDDGMVPFDDDISAEEDRGEEPEPALKPEPNSKATDSSSETAEPDPPFRFGDTFASGKPLRKEKSIRRWLFVFFIGLFILGSLIWLPEHQTRISKWISHYFAQKPVPADLPGKERRTVGNDSSQLKTPADFTEDGKDTSSSAEQDGIIENPLDAALHLIPPLIARIEERRINLEKLSRYYKNGVDDDIGVVRNLLKANKIKTLDAAMSHTGIELKMRRISYRMHYLSEIDRLTGVLVKAREELTYIKRKSEIDAMFIPVSEDIKEDRIIEEINNAVSRSRNLPDHLVVRNDSGGGIPIKTVWKDIVNGKKNTPSIRAEGRDIKTEICEGRFSNAHALTRLTPEIAECLAAWKGKDLYLGGISRLTPASAAAISQWSGEWLILNGLDYLSRDTAEQLSRWKGTRLSLNGLNRISEQTLNQLLTWDGTYLETAGLTAVDGLSNKYEILRMLNRIAKWEGEGRVLYLSDRFLNRLNEVVQDTSSLRPPAKRRFYFALARYRGIQP